MKNYTIYVNGTPYNVSVEEGASAPVAAPVSTPAPQTAPAPAVQEAAPAPTPAPSSSAGSVKVDAPMPGNILDIKVSSGASVNKGDVLVVLEAMKMENDIVAPQNGTIASVNVSKGDTVEAGATLITMN